MSTSQARRAFLRQSFAWLVAGGLGACQGEAVSPPGVPVPTDLPAPAVGGGSPAPSRVVPSVSATDVRPTFSPTADARSLVTPSAVVQERFSGEQALRYAAAQMQWVPRDTGSAGWRQCGDYIMAQLKQSGWAVEEQSFPYQGVVCRNIIGKRGSGPYVIIGAHYDSRRRADQDPDVNKHALPVPAANDGASGVAVLLELARVVRPEEVGCAIWLAAFDAEDNGELDGWEWVVGSSFLARSLVEAPLAVVVVDMIGDADQQIFYERNSDLPIMQGIWRVAASLGYSASFLPQERYAMLDDHSPFLRQGYRAVDIIDFDYPSWHTTADTLDKVSAASLEAVGRTIQEWLVRGMPGSADVPQPSAVPYPAPGQSGYPVPPRVVPSPQA